VIATFLTFLLRIAFLFGCLLCFHRDFRIDFFSISVMNVIILIEIILSLYIILCGIVIFTILILSICESRVSFCVLYIPRFFSSVFSSFY
jgi:hypothetical protein